MAQTFKSPRPAVLALACALLCGHCGLWDAAAAYASNVQVIVNPTLYASGQITAGLDRYLADLQLQGYDPVLTTTSFANPAALRTHLAEQYTTVGLAGAVLIGDLPISYFERNGQFGNPNNYERFACDLYYMDVDGFWTDEISSVNPGTYDTHSGDIAPEIWLGRMPVSPLVALHPDRTEASLLDDYFQKNHAYRAGSARMPSEGLAYIDDDWGPWASTWANHLSASVSGGVELVDDGATTTAADYLARLSPSAAAGYESVLLAAHSNVSYHKFEIGGELTGGTVNASQLADADPQAFFYNLFCCSNAAYNMASYMAGEYVFGTNDGLLAVGTTKTGGMLDFDHFYNPLATGRTFGESLLDWWTFELRYGSGGTVRDWFYGMTLLGDPALLSQMFVDLAGDLNGDDFVGSDDLDIVRSHWGQTVTPGDRLSGDTSGDGFVGADDLDIIRLQWGLSAPPSPAAIPEPATTLLLLTAAPALLLLFLRRPLIPNP